MPPSAIFPPPLRAGVNHNSPIQEFQALLYGPTSGTVGNVVQWDVTGTIFFVKDALYPFKVSFDDGPWISIEVGLSVHWTAPDVFKKISVRTDDPQFADPSPLSISVYIGNVVVQDSRLNTRFDRTNPVFVKEAPSQSVGAVVSLPAASNYTIPARLLGNQRKQLIININGPNGLQLQNPIGTPLFNLPPNGTPFTLFSSDGYLIRNTTGSAITFSVLEIFYS
jgi:hypothetical protein